MLHPIAAACREHDAPDPSARTADDLRRSIAATNAALHTRISALKAGTHRLTEGYTALRASYADLRTEVAAMRQELDGYESASDA
ncbi:MAG: hypothetical protein WA208_19280 [Thermoanaerobaculia bacterium]|jgi:hypothetical protein